MRGDSKETKERLSNGVFWLPGNPNYIQAPRRFGSSVTWKPGSESEKKEMYLHPYMSSGDFLIDYPDSYQHQIGLIKQYPSPI